MSDLRMEPVPLTDLMNGGVLMAANERFFWPFGLALTWHFDPETGEATNLFVTQWNQPDGERERIDLDEVDEVGEQRRAAFAEWSTARLATMLPAEAAEARRRLGIE